MTTHDVSSEFFGLVHADETAAFQLDETRLARGNGDELPSNLVLDYMQHRMHGDSSITHIPGLHETRPLMLSQHTTATSEVYSVRYRLRLAGLALRQEATSIIVPHDTDLPRLAEVHGYSFGNTQLNENAPRPLTDRQYQILRHIGHAANLTQALRIAS